MAIREEELLVREAVVYRFPSEAVRGRQARTAVLRGRRRLLSAAAVVVSVALLTAWTPAGPVTAAGRTPGRVVVGPGDTLWDIAEAHAPESMDPRAYIDELQELNGLAGQVRAGMTLRLPR